MLRIRDLGALDGSILLFGGPYSNLEATKAVLQAATDNAIPVERIILTGDIIGYCGNPAETLELIRKSGVAAVAGAVESQLGDAGATMEEPWYRHAEASLAKSDRDWLAGLPQRLLFRHQGKRYVVFHGTAGHPESYLWRISNEDDFWRHISLLQEEVGVIDAVIAGQTGIAFERWIDGVHWINPGAIGMPANDGQQETVHAILQDGEVRFEPLGYDVAAAVAAMQAAGLTQGHEIALKTGYWPNDDMLPKSLRR
ncbi:MAG: metallophosphoesterase family protein [Rhodobacteraceae bacterium]|nr:metallophosphoesterase family protein [Paracoccaceae bacterium]